MRLPRRSSTRPQIETIEPRLLYSADHPAALLTASAWPAAAAQEHALMQQRTAASTAQPSVEIVFIDARVPEAQAVADRLAAQAGAGRAIEVVTIDRAEDGLARIGAVLQGRHDIAAVHLIGHGAEGEITLGGTRIDSGMLLERADEVARWGDALAADGDLLLYGCNTGAGTAGRQLVDDLAQLTGTDVAASDDLTGSRLAGGDFDLEVRHGRIEAAPLFDGWTRDHWNGVLATYTVTTTADSGAGSLRQAITDANNNAGPDIIDFNIAGTGVHTINLLSALPGISGQVTIDGYTQSGASVNTAATGTNAVLTIELNGLSAGTGARGINLLSSATGSTIRGLVVNRFDGGGIWVGSGSTTVVGNFIGTDATGMTALANGKDAAGIGGVRVNVAGSAVIGTSNLADRNLIAGNRFADVYFSGAGNGVIRGNIIGTNATATAVLTTSASYGAVGFTNFSTNGYLGGTGAGEGNLIAGGDANVTISTGSASRIAVLGNLMYGATAAADMAIDLGDNGVTANDAGDADTGFNLLQNYPVLTGAHTDGAGNARITGTLNTTANTYVRIELFAVDAANASTSGHGGALRFLGYVNALSDANGNVTFGTTLAAALTAGEKVSATATVATDASYTSYTVTSEFSTNVTATAAAVITSGGGGATAGVAVAETTTAVTTVAASGGGITYSIVGGADSAKFSIDGSTGALAFVAAPDYEAPTDSGTNNVYDVIVQASNGATTSTQAIAVTVTDVAGSLTVTTATDNNDAGIATGATYTNEWLNAHKGADGKISLREAIIAANNTAGADTINFAIAGSGVQTIALASQLPTITSQITIDGYTQTGASVNTASTGTNAVLKIVIDGSAAGSIDGLLLTTGSGGSVIRGLVIQNVANFAINAAGAASGTSIVGNFIGTDATGLVARPNGWGVFNNGEANLTIGSAALADRNLISGNSHEAVQVSGGSGTKVQGNLIGVDAGGSTPIGAAWGRFYLDSAAGMMIGGVNPGEGNVIYGAGSGTVNFAGGSATQGAVLGNVIIGTATYGIDNGNNGTTNNDSGDGDTGANNLQNFPVLSAAETDGAGNVGISGTLDSTANSYFRIELFATPAADAFGSGHGGASRYLGYVNVATNGSGNASFSVQLVGTLAVGEKVTATATLSNATYTTFTATSEFATNVTATAAPAITSNGGGATASGSIAETTAAVTTVTASGSGITYSIIGGADAAKFTIDASTGALAFVTAPDYESPTDAGADNVYDVIVQASDGMLADTQAIAVTVTDVSGVATVTTTSDNNDSGVTAGNGTHTIEWLNAHLGADGKVSLREAIIAANNTSGADTIRFAIAGGGVQTITLASALPTITDTLTLDGYTQPGSSANTLAVGNDAVHNLVIDGNGLAVDGLVLSSTADTSTIRGLVIQDFGGDGIQIDAGSDGNTIAGNFIGSLSSSGTLAAGAGVSGAGVYVLGANNTIGGTAPADRNVISGTGNGVNMSGAGSTGNLVLGNYLGSDAAGVTMIGQSNSNVLMINGASSNTVGGASAGARNILVGAGLAGVNISGAASTSNLVLGNWIGLGADGSTLLGNGDGVQLISGASNNQIGAIGAGNVIVGNGLGIEITSSTGGNASGNVIIANYIGTDASGTLNGGNTSSGIILNSNAIGNTIGGTAAGAGNVIANNGFGGSSTNGVHVRQTSAAGNAILGNSIYSNAALGIELGANGNGVTANDAGDADTGHNNLQNYPVLTSARTDGGSAVIGGTLNSAANSYYRIEFYASSAGDGSGNGEGQRYLGFVNVATDASGNASFTATLAVPLAAGEIVSATATRSNASYATFSDTSEFALNVTAVSSAVITSNGGGASASINVPEATAAVTTVTATGSGITYAIIGGADAAKFSIDASTGVLVFVAAPDYESPTDADGDNVYQVIVQASDGTLVDTQTVSVTVTPVNEHAPVIAGGANAAVNVAENTTAVKTVVATDADLPAQGITYAIVGGADAAKFSIDASTGALVFVAAPDYENPGDADGNNVYQVVVQASDGSLVDTQTISVTVTPVNEHAPVISGGANASVNVAENATAVKTVVATDADLPAQGITYSIVGGADAAKFTIDASTGALVFVAAPDYENPGDADGDNVYQVIVQASDGSLVDTQTLSVTVTPVNEHAPVIAGGANAAVNVAENTTAVTTVVATDADLPAQGITYSIVGGADAAKFSIDASTGALVFVAAPDYENPADTDGDNVYKVIVQASDGSLVDTQTVSVTVTPVNEHAPVISGGPADAVNVAENAMAVKTVVATDEDLPAQGITYSIVGGADAAKFSIDASTGALVFVDAPDYESPTDADGNNVYDVIVQASDGALVDTQTVSVTVTPVNEQAPVIAGGANASVNVAENATAVKTVVATDADLPAQGITYSIVGGADAASFSIDASTGALVFVSAPDCESPTDADGDNVYQVIVQASDGSLVDTQTISVTVTPVNEHAPVIAGGANAAVNVAENSTTVKTVVATDADLPAQGITYSIVGGADAAQFSIDASTGALVFVTAPDYENPTDSDGDNVYQVIVQASDGSLVDSQTLSVTVTPVNEHAPVIAGGANASVNVTENATAVKTVVATDADLPAQGITYSIVGGADAAKFSIDASTGALVFVAAPDYENPGDADGNNVYQVIVQASDGSLVDTQTVSVTVTPVNEHAPTIAGGASASVNVAENATAVTTVVATDADQPAQGITYSIVGGADAASFSIDASTGALVFVSAPDYENPGDANGDNVYQVIVQASDGSLVDTQTVSVTVTPVNEHAPVIAGGANASVNVAENTTAVKTVVATDADLPAQGITYAIVGGADAAKFSIDASTGALVFVGAPDYESPADADGDNVYQVVVQASDGSLVDTQTVSVTVTPVNEHAPVIAGGANVSVNMAENTTAVATVVATDADLPAQGITYAVVGGADAAQFSIDASTGALTFVSAPDYESPGDADGDNVYQVVVQASDGSLVDTQTVSVTVTPVNEHAPVISGGPVDAVNVAENSTAVATVVATDADLPAQGITYSIVGGADAAKFSVDASTGALVFVSSPDHESPTDADGDNVYQVIVQASDGSLVDTQTLSVTVTPVNEHAPVIAGGANASVNVAENATAVKTVVATDADLPAQGITYSIVGGADAASFTIDASTGALVFVSAPDYENPADADGDNVYEVIVQASDGSLVDTQTIAVTAVPVNEHAPVIAGGANAAANVAENTTAVTTIVATDADLPAQGITYSIVGGADAAKFSIDASTGALVFVAAPDHESPGDSDGDNVYQVIVQASDGSLVDTQTIAVTVTPVNEHAPVIAGGPNTSVNVAENATAVTTVVAADTDLPAQGISYSIVGGADAAKFGIDASTGALVFVAAPDYESPGDSDGDNVYQVIVQASDGSLVDTQTISVTVTPVNEHAPVIAGGANTSVNVAENATAVKTIVATDADLPSQGVTYSIVGGTDAAKFSIDASTGALVFVTAPDYENPTDSDGDNVYQVIVQASDGSLVDSQTLSVTVTPINEHAPVIAGGANASVNVAENTIAVKTVVATDADLPAQGITYAIVGGADAAQFSIDASTGALVLVVAPDYENPGDADGDNVYQVVVQASDGSLVDTQTVSVTVTPVNEHAPVISGGASVSVNVAENATAVKTVVATDADLPAQGITYSIVGGADAASFSIDASTGALVFVSTPDYENPVDADGDNVYEVIVQASDGSLVDTQTVSVAVTPVNEHAPVISGGANASVNVAENATAVKTVVATDADLPAQGIAYAIVGGTDAAKFSIDASTGALVFVAAPDYETPGDANGDNVYQVVVQASDGSLVDTQTVSVTVTPVNEHAPTIAGGANASVNVAENATAVKTVVATDADLPAQGITYSIVGGADAAKFGIDASTGALVFVAAPDYENPGDADGDNVYQVVVQASDGSLVDSQTLSVTVTPVNEHAPVISGGANASANVAENTTAVKTVVATDADLPAQGITYSIVGGADAAKFSIDASTGALVFVAAPDYENPGDANGDNVYQVIVQASDGSLVDTQTVSVTVTPVNEHAPVISGGANASVNVTENATAVKTVVATDADLPAQGITYSIVGGADAAKFGIDASTGALVFVAAPDYESPADADGDNVYQVVVQASDGSLVDSQTLSVTVTPVNEHAPVIAGGANAAVNVAENTTAVKTFVATDADLPAQGITYAIVGGTDAAKFSIDASTGALVFVAAPDYENPGDANGDNVYQVIVQASDGSLVDSQTIAVTVTPANDHAPVIAGGANAAVNVAENTTAVKTVVATDADLPAQGITYAIVGGADAAKFSIDASTGALVFVAAPDYENPGDADGNNVYQVVVQASDGSLVDSQTITVTVMPVNEHAPAIAGGGNASVNVAENATAVKTVVATDADLPAQGITYSIVGGADAASFSIDASTGALVFVSAPDYENPGDANGDNVYQVVVQASDGSLVDSQTITVTVMPVNEHAPAIAGGGNASANVAENTTAVKTVVATDADLPAQGITYSIVGGADAAKFSIDASTGALVFVAAPDYGNPADANGDNVYQVIVQASDGSLVDTQTISVAVTPVNAHAPVIAGGANASVNVAENTTAVKTIVAADADLPAQGITYSIVGGADAAKFSIDASTGALVFVAAPDYENPGDSNRDNVYQVVVEASDGTWVDTQAVSVTVTPVNEHAPVISGGPADAVNVAENTTIVKAVVASDADLPAQGITYSIVGGGDAAKFRIDASTGALVFVSAPDHENPADADGDNVYEVIVQASDGSLVDAQTLSITVTPVNEHAPAIAGGAHATVNVAENATAVKQVIATDADLPAQGITYAIVGGADASKFRIDASTGALVFFSAPDYENPVDADGNNVYQVVVQASDGERVDTQAISVTVTPVNERAPVIIAPAGVVAAAGGHAEVVRIIAVDADRPDDRLVFRIAGGADAAAFRIDPDSGLLRFAAPPDAGQPGDADGDNVYEVVIGVGDGRWTTRETLQVQVTDETPPPPPPPAPSPPSPPAPPPPPSPAPSPAPAPAPAPTPAPTPAPAPDPTPAPAPHRPDHRIDRAAADGPWAVRSPAPVGPVAADRGTLHGDQPFAELDLVAEALAAFEATRAESAAAPRSSGESSIEIDLQPTAAGAKAEAASIESAVLGGIGATVGVLAWASRGSALLAGMMVSAPAWSAYDILPVLKRRRPDEDEAPPARRRLPPEAAAAAAEEPTSAAR